MEECNLLVVRCSGLAVNPNSFKKSLISNFFSSSNQNEKRVIKISQSEPFKLGGRPTNFNFGLIYTSETFEDNSDISPSLVVSIKCPMEMDVKMRFNVYYSSNKTNSKEVLLASTTFSLHELLRTIKSKGELVSDMISEYCINAKAYVQIIDELHKPLVNNRNFNIVASERQNENPFFQRYVFYAPHIKTQAHIIANEWSWEPKFSAMLSKLYIENITASLVRSMYAWNIRCELERKRQGRFHSLDEALKHGWHSIDICVIGLRMNRSKASNERIKSLTRRSTTSESHHQWRNSSLTHKSHLFADADTVLETNTKQQQHYESNSTSQQHMNSSSTTTVFLPVACTPVLAFNHNTATLKSKGVKRIDETAPSTFVEISVLNRSQTFLTSIGRTNTEYFNCNPLYGSNLNANYAKKSAFMNVASSSSDTVVIADLVKEFGFYAFDVTDKDYLNDVYYRYCHEVNNNNNNNDTTTTATTTMKATHSSDKLSSSSSSNIVFPLVDGSVSVIGKETHFFHYLSTCKDTYIYFDLYGESQQNKIKIGTCRLKIQPGKTQNVWLPLKVDCQTFPHNAECYELYDNIELNVNVSVKSPETTNTDDNISTEPIIPAEMSSVYKYDRSAQGVVVNSCDIDTNDIKSLYGDYKQSIADCYEWMWYAGFNGYDPLMYDSNENNTTIISTNTSSDRKLLSTSSSSSSSKTDVHHLNIQQTSQLNLNTAEERNVDSDTCMAIMDADMEYIRESLFTSCIDKELIDKKNTELDGKDLLSTQSNMMELSSMNSNVSFKKHKICSRSDIFYPLDWIKNHIKQIEELIFEFRSILPALDSRIKSDYGFRASALKKESDVQVLPVNLHYQLMVIKAYHSKIKDQEDKDKSQSSSSSSSTTPTTTTGKSLHSPLPSTNLPVGSDVYVMHTLTCGSMSPHMLGHNNGGLYYLEQNLVTQKIKLENSKDIYRSKLISAGSHNISLAQEHQWGVYKQISNLKELVLNFESTCLSVARRKIYATSQALSIAVNGLLLKLALVQEGQITESTCEQWVQYGVLIIFEGLLSVIKHERSMLEDTMSAIDALRSFQVRVLPFINDDDNIDEHQNIKLEMKGREIIIFMSLESAKLFPQSYQQAIYKDGLVFTFVPVLFTQGIDMQQTMVSTFGGDKSKSAINPLSLQHNINLRALLDINKYIHKVKSLMSTQSNESNLHDNEHKTGPYTIHPLVSHLHELILSTNIGEKNVDMLIEVERLALIIGAIKVVFCKSGKDRTGMASTLEQSRQLGERFGCGMSMARLMHDANLMRVHGCRLLVCEKNIGRKVYSINKLQAQFLPVVFRPPNEVCEDLLKKDNS